MVHLVSRGVQSTYKKISNYIEDINRIANHASRVSHALKLKSFIEYGPFKVRWPTPPPNCYKSIGLLKLLSIYME